MSIDIFGNSYDSTGVNITAGGSNTVPNAADRTYKGVWNAFTNTPTITSSIGTLGDFYVVSVAGTTNIDGNSNWGIGDEIIFNGLVWQQIDKADIYVPKIVSVDNVIAKFDGVTGLLQNSGIVVSDTNDLSDVNTIQSTKIPQPPNASAGTVKTYISNVDSRLHTIDENGNDSSLGDVSGPALVLDNTIPRYDGTTGKIIQSSGATIDDLNNLRTNIVTCGETFTDFIKPKFNPILEINNTLDRGLHINSGLTGGIKLTGDNYQGKTGDVLSLDATGNVTTKVFDHLLLSNVGVKSHAQIDLFITDQENYNAANNAKLTHITSTTPTATNWDDSDITTTKTVFTNAQGLITKKYADDLNTNQQLLIDVNTQKNSKFSTNGNPDSILTYNNVVVPTLATDLVNKGYVDGLTSQIQSAMRYCGLYDQVNNVPDLTPAGAPFIDGCYYIANGATPTIRDLGSGPVNIRSGDWIIRQANFFNILEERKEDIIDLQSQITSNDGEILVLQNKTARQNTDTLWNGDVEPFADNFGSVGTNARKWANVYSLNVTSPNIRTPRVVNQTDNLSIRLQDNATGSIILDGLNYTGTLEPTLLKVDTNGVLSKAALSDVAGTVSFTGPAYSDTNDDRVPVISGTGTFAKSGVKIINQNIEAKDIKCQKITGDKGGPDDLCLFNQGGKGIVLLDTGVIEFTGDDYTGTGPNSKLGRVLTLNTTNGGIGAVIPISNSSFTGVLDNSIVRHDGLTGKVIQGSSVLIDDVNSISGVNVLAATSINSASHFNSTGDAGITLTTGTGSEVILNSTAYQGAVDDQMMLIKTNGRLVKSTALLTETGDITLTSSKTNTRNNLSGTAGITLIDTAVGDVIFTGTKYDGVSGQVLSIIDATGTIGPIPLPPSNINGIVSVEEPAASGQYDITFPSTQYQIAGTLKIDINGKIYVVPDPTAVAVVTPHNLTTETSDPNFQVTASSILAVGNGDAYRAFDSLTTNSTYFSGANTYDAGTGNQITGSIAPMPGTMLGTWHALQFNNVDKIVNSITLTTSDTSGSVLDFKVARFDGVNWIDTGFAVTGVPNIALTPFVYNIPAINGGGVGNWKGIAIVVSRTHGVQVYCGIRELDYS